MPKTTVSSKGQVVLPKAVRDARRWKAGTRLIVEVVPEGVLLRDVPVVGTTTARELLGCTGYRGPRRSVEEMDAAVEAEARRSG